jgi:hypothetical protein
MPDVFREPESYKYYHRYGTYEVNAHYTGDATFVDVIKAALKRDLELVCNGDNEK